MLARSSSAPTAETSTISLVRTNSRNFDAPLPTQADGCDTWQPLRALAALLRTFYYYSARIARIGQMWRPAWRLFLPSGAPPKTPEIKPADLFSPPSRPSNPQTPSR